MSEGADPLSSRAGIETGDRPSRRRKVLLVTSSFPRWRGDSTAPFILNLAQDFNELGWLTLVLAPHAPGARIEESIEGVSVRRFRYLWPESLQTVCYHGGALYNLRSRRRNFLKLPALVASEWVALMRALLRFDPDVVHSHWLLPQGLTAGIATAITRTAHVTTIHGSDVFALQGAGMRLFKRIAIRLSDAVTVNSTATQQAVEKILTRPRPIIRIPMGASAGELLGEHQVEALRSRYVRGNGPLLAFVGRLVDQKGVSDLLLAVSHLAKAGSNASAVIVGEGPERERLERLAGELAIEHRVFFAGRVEAADVPLFLAAADAFVGPSKKGVDGSLEGQGLAFAEAMFAGTPVIATPSGGIVDAVQHDVTGLLVRENAPAEIAAAVQRLWRNPELARRLAEAALALARRDFTREGSARSFVNLFERVLAQHARGRFNDHADTARRRR